MEDLSFIQQLLPGLDLELILNPKLPAPFGGFPLMLGKVGKWEDIVEPENNVPAKPVVTAIQLMQICTRLKADKAKQVEDVLNVVLPKYGMDHVDYLEEFLPNVIVESQEFSRFEENLNYSTKGLLDTFPKYYNTALAEREQHQPKLIANRVYGGRMGNTEPNDGWENRGSGGMMLTGKAVMSMYAKYKGLDVANVPGLLRTNLEYALDSACWFFAVYKSLKDEALKDLFIKICKIINGGTNGLESREFYHERTLKVLK